MKKVTTIFHWISYLQYPLNAIAILYLLKFYYDILVLDNFDLFLNDINKGLIFLGIGISFSTLQDTTKTQNNFSKKIWQSRKRGKIALVIISLLISFFLLSGLFSLYVANSDGLQEMALGLIVMGIGCIGLLKVAVEMYEYHRKE